MYQIDIYQDILMYIYQFMNILIIDLWGQIWNIWRVKQNRIRVEMTLVSSLISYHAADHFMAAITKNFVGIRLGNSASTLKELHQSLPKTTILLISYWSFNMGVCGNFFKIF